jgi:hypothetical protein
LEMIRQNSRYAQPGQAAADDNGVVKLAIHRRLRSIPGAELGMVQVGREAR